MASFFFFFFCPTEGPTEHWFQWEADGVCVCVCVHAYTLAESSSTCMYNQSARAFLLQKRTHRKNERSERSQDGRTWEKCEHSWWLGTGSSSWPQACWWLWEVKGDAHFIIYLLKCACSTYHSLAPFILFHSIYRSVIKGCSASDDHKTHTATGLVPSKSVTRSSHVILQRSSCFVWAARSFQGSPVGFLVPEHSEPFTHSGRSNMRVWKPRSGALAEQHEWALRMFW